jgi:hypothetical protein
VGPLDQLHGEVAEFGGLADFIDRHDVRMRQPGHGLGLLLEEPDRFFRVHALRQDFHGDPPLQALLVGREHDPHPAAGQLLQNSGRADGHADGLRRFKGVYSIHLVEHVHSSLRASSP